MKLMILANSDIGLYAFRKELIEEFVKEHEVIVVVPFEKKIDQLKRLGGTYINASINRRGTNIFQDYKLLKNYKKYMKQEKPDIVITYTIKPNIYGGMAAKSLNIPQIANITGLGTAVENKGLLQKITTILYRIALRKAHTVFFQNEENMLYFQKNKIALGKHELIPGSGVNLTHFNLTPYPTDKIIKFVFVSRIMKEKGIDLYLNSAKYFMSKYNNLEFHICGSLDENYNSKIESLVRNNTIIYHGVVNDVKKIIDEMHAIIHPTYYPEGMSNVLLEAAAIGRPGIASNRSGCKEIIDDGTSGYLFEPQNQILLDECIQRFINLSFEDKKTMGIRAREKVEVYFDRQIVINRYLESIRKV